MSDNILQTGKGKDPLRTKMESEEFYQGLDKGIRFAVRVLHSVGIETCQSCQGGKDHCYENPTVELTAADDDATGFVALAALQAYGQTVSAVSIRWSIRNGLPYEKLWRIEFVKTMEDRADEELPIIWGYQFQPTPKRDKRKHK